MKKIINGRLYDTDTATLLGSWDNGYGSDFRSCREYLYRKKTGEFFLHGHGGAKTVYAETHGNCWSAGDDIIPYTEEKAKVWAEEKLPAEKYLEIFDAEE